MHAILRQRLRGRAPRFLAGALLIGVAASIEGIVGAALALTAVAVVLDGLVPAPGLTYPEADDRFCRLVRRRRRARLLCRITRRPLDELEVLPAVLGERHAAGVQWVALATITGTAEPAKARIFDAAFRPDASVREHWKRVWVAQATQALPPVAVYRLGGRHFVIDGHHRVSAARERGLGAIEAEVVELRASPRSARPRKEFGPSTSGLSPDEQQRTTTPPAP